jgi:hypothetical protein
MAQPIPVDAGDLTPDWLSGALQARHPGVRVGAAEVLDTTERTNLHVRLRLDYDVRAGAPDTVFCKLPPLDPAHRQMIGATGMGTREASFYADLAPSVSMRMPAAYLAASDTAGNFVLVLEDLSARGCRISDGTWAIAGDLAAGAVEDLAELHVRFQDTDRLRAIAPWASVQRERSPDFTLRTLRSVVEQHAEVLSDAYVAVAELYIEHHAAIDELWSRGPHTLIHGDAHIGNVFIDDGRVGFLDWGMLTVSAAMRDVSFFLTMGMDSTDRRSLERDLVQHYVDVRRSLGGAELTFDDAWMAHRVHAAYTVLASFLTMVPPYNTEARRPFTEAFRARASASLDDLDTVGALAELGIA